MKRDVNDLKLLLGVWGETLWHFANGLDSASVRQTGEENIVNINGSIRPLTIKWEDGRVFYLMMKVSGS